MWLNKQHIVSVKIYKTENENSKWSEKIVIFNCMNWICIIRWYIVTIHYLQGKHFPFLLFLVEKFMCCHSLFYIKGYNSYYNAVLIQVKRKRNMPCHYQICYHANRNFSFKSFIKHDNMNQNINKYMCFGNNCNLHNTCFLYTFKI